MATHHSQHNNITTPTCVLLSVRACRERQYRIAMEQAEMARARRVALEEEEERRQEKERMKAAQDELKVENEKNKVLKLEALVMQQNYDKKLNADYE